MIGEIVHIELPSRDFVRSAAFYGKVFGWKTDGVQSGGHLSFDLPGGVQGSWIRDALAQAPGPVPFVAVADVDKTLADAEKQGGRILVQRMTLPNRGVFGLFADCDGNIVGVLAAKGDLSRKDAAPAVTTPARTGAPSATVPPDELDKPVKSVPSGGAAPASDGKARKATAALKPAAKKPPTRKR